MRMPVRINARHSQPKSITCFFRNFDFSALTDHAHPAVRAHINCHCVKRKTAVPHGAQLCVAVQNKALGALFSALTTLSGHHSVYRVITSHLFCFSGGAKCATIQIAQRRSKKKRIMPSKRHQCSKCPKTFGRSNDLKRHVRILHSESGSVPRFACEEKGCEKSFPRAKSLTQHMRIVHKVGLVKFSCMHCPKKFNVKSNMTKHVRRMHSANKVVSE